LKTIQLFILFVGLFNSSFGQYTNPNVKYLRTNRIGLVECYRITVNEETRDTSYTLSQRDQINTFGFPTSVVNFDSVGQEQAKTIFLYKDDSLVVEQISEPNEFKILYDYDVNNRVIALYFYQQNELITYINQYYNKKGELKSTKQYLIGSKKRKSNSGFIQTKYQYNDKKGITSIKVKKLMDHKGPRYSTSIIEKSKDRNIQTRMVKDELFPDGILVDRTIYSNEGDIIIKEHFFRSKSTMVNGSTKTVFEKGDIERTVFEYNEKKLMSKQTRYKNDLLLDGFVYKYK
jgi:hypothetical protein